MNLQLTPVVKQLLIANILFFILSQFVQNSYEILALYYFETPTFRFWQPLTHMFMHGGYMHIGFNMLALVSFGNLIENFWGGNRFLFFYIACGLGACVINELVTFYKVHSVLNDTGLTVMDLKQLYINIKETEDIVSNEILQKLEKAGVNQKMFDTLMGSSIPMVGASGAIYGLLVAFAFMFPNSEMMMIFIPVPVKAKFFVPILVGLDLFSGITGYSIFSPPNTGFFAHVGGAITGVILMYIWRNKKFNHNRWN